MFSEKSTQSKTLVVLEKEDRTSQVKEVCIVYDNGKVVQKQNGIKVCNYFLSPTLYKELEEEIKGMVKQFPTQYSNYCVEFEKDKEDTRYFDGQRTTIKINTPFKKRPRIKLVNHIGEYDILDKVIKRGALNK